MTPQEQSGHHATDQAARRAFDKARTESLLVLDRAKDLSWRSLPLAKQKAFIVQASKERQGV